MVADSRAGVFIVMVDKCFYQQTDARSFKLVHQRGESSNRILDFAEHIQQLSQSLTHIFRLLLSKVPCQLLNGLTLGDPSYHSRYDLITVNVNSS